MVIDSYQIRLLSLKWNKKSNNCKTLHYWRYCKRRFIRSLGARAITYIGPRRGPTMLNRMWSEAELAVYMLQITSSSKRANSCLLFAPFGDGCGGFDLPQVPFPSVTTHAVKHSSPPSGTGVDVNFYPKDLRMNTNCKATDTRAVHHNRIRKRAHSVKI